MFIIHILLINSTLPCSKFVSIKEKENNLNANMINNLHNFLRCQDEQQGALWVPLEYSICLSYQLWNVEVIRRDPYLIPFNYGFYDLSRHCLFLGFPWASYILMLCPGDRRLLWSLVVFFFSFEGFPDVFLAVIPLLWDWIFLS